MLLVLCNLHSMAQLRNANWVFTHWVQFGYGAPQVMPGVNFGTGNASLSNTQGQLLLYTGDTMSPLGPVTVLKRANGIVIPAPSPFYAGYLQTTQSWLLLPWPGDTTKVATVRRQFDQNSTDRDLTWLMLGCVDLTGNGGNGAITAPPVVLDDSMAHKLTAVPHANGEDYWILSHQIASDAFYAYQLSAGGVDPVPVISHAGSALPQSVGGFPYYPMIHGSLVASYAGDALVCVSFSANPAWPDTSITELFHFDNATGEVTFWAALDPHRSFMGEGGAEFSPDGSKLYVAEVPYTTNTLRLVQYDLSDPTPSAILNSEVVIQETVGQASNLITGVPIAAGPDGRVYLGKGPGAQFLALIEHPDSAGMACGPQPNGLFLPNPAAGFFTMPNFCKRYHDSEMTVGQAEPTEAAPGLTLWPVPAGEALQVLVPGAGRLEVLDMLGRPVHVSSAARQGMVELDLGPLGQGTYVLRYHDRAGAVLSRPFVKE